MQEGWSDPGRRTKLKWGTRLQWGTLMIPVSGPNGLGWLLNIKPGQKAWGEDSNILDSCDGQVISNININVDFDVIKYQWSCSFTNVFSVEILYIPCRNPGVDYCKNAIQINEINGKQRRISCSSSPASLVSTAYIQLQWSWCFEQGYWIFSVHIRIFIPKQR